MKRIPAKLIITFWFTMLMVAIAALVMVFMLTASRLTMEQDMQRRVLQAVKGNIKGVRYDNDAIQAGGGFRYYANGVSCAIYDGNGRKIAGEFPESFTADVDFSDGILRTKVSGGKSYYVYDRYITFKNGRHAWIRGVSLTTATVTVASTVAKVAMYVLPGVVAASSVGGYFITRAALKPIDKISRMSDDIAAGGDLSRRLNMKKVTREAYSLAQSYDKMLERLERSFDMEKQFTSNASHELRTPTAVIISQCEYALEHDRTTEDFRETIEVIKRHARRMNAMVSQMLSFSRLEQGTKKAEPELANLSDIVAAVCEEQQAINEDVSFETDIEPEVMASVDVAMMTHLVENLVSNACKFGGRHVKAGLYREEGEICLFVRDDGIGIAEKDQAKVWDRFWQGDASRSFSKGGSSGLGLAMVKQIARMHGGRMYLESAPHQGSTFSFRMSAAGDAGRRGEDSIVDKVRNKVKSKVKGKAEKKVKKKESAPPDGGDGMRAGEARGTGE